MMPKHTTGYDLSRSFWMHAARHAVWLINRAPIRHSREPARTSPYAVYYGRPPDLKHMRTFGCRCWVWLERDRREGKSKLSPVARPMRFLGYADDGRGHGFIVWDPQTDRIKTRYSMVFEEQPTLTCTATPLDDPSTGDAPARDRSVGNGAAPVSTDAVGAMADDGWMTEYVCSDEETIQDIAERHRLDPATLQEHNGGLPGAPPSGLTPIDEPLRQGTGLWLPTTCMPRRPTHVATVADVGAPADATDDETQTRVRGLG